MKTFSMSMYMSKEALYKDKAEYYQKRYETIQATLESFDDSLEAGEIDDPKEFMEIYKRLLRYVRSNDE